MFCLPKTAWPPTSLTKPSDRIGTIGIPLDLNKVRGIVFTNQKDSPSTIVPPDDETVIMAHLILHHRRKRLAAVSRRA